jgi:hypothetical protein
MKILLKELINPNTALLNDTQKAVLIITLVSTSPEIAYRTTGQSKNLGVARDALNKMGMVSIKQEGLTITNRGKSMLRYHNLITDSGKLTDEGDETLNKITDVGSTYSDEHVREEFIFIKTLP